MSNKLITYIKEEEFNQLLKAEKKREFKLAYLFAFGSGLRISEIIGYERRDGKAKIQPLQPNQIDLQARTIKVIGGKGMKDRIVPLFTGFKQDYLKMLPLNIKRTTLQAHFKALCKKVLGRDCHFHELRHGFGVLATKRNVPMPFLQQAMGHSRLDTTGIYTKASPEEMLKSFQNAGWEI
jgi:integrase